MSFNKITIVGYLGRDPELKHTPQGTAVCKFSVATTERRKGANGEPEEFTTWFRVTVWGRQAELASEYLSKGRQVYVEGRLRLEEYTDRDGNQRTSPEVNATDLQFLGQRNDGDGGQPMSARSTSEMTAGRGQMNQHEEDAFAETPSLAARKETAAKIMGVAAGMGGATSKPRNARSVLKEKVSVNDDEVPF